MSTEKYNQFNASWYASRIQNKESNIEVLSSGTEERRKIRFQVLKDVGIESGCSVLDIGCGFGDFYSYLKEQKIDVSYTGVDIAPVLIDGAKKQHPNLKFELRDFLKDKFSPQSFDYIVCSQVLNLSTPGVDNSELARLFLKEMHNIAKKGVACDFITSYVDFKEDYLYYHSPEQVFGFAKSVSKRVILRHDYPSYEFCIYLYPDFQGWRNGK